MQNLLRILRSGEQPLEFRGTLIGERVFRPREGFALKAESADDWPRLQLFRCEDGRCIASIATGPKGKRQISAETFESKRDALVWLHEQGWCSHRMPDFVLKTR